MIANLGRISRNLRRCRQDILEFGPDALILIDYSGFNLRIANWAKPAGFRVLYYISPKVWVWNSRRVESIKKNVDRMFVILPFEVDFYRDHDYPVEYVGNPVLDAVEEHARKPVPRKEFLSRNGLEDRPIIALLAGSRKQEIRYCLPEMLAVTGEFPRHQFVIAGAPGLDAGVYEKYSNGHKVPVIFEQTYSLLMQADAAVVTSGTATLETALFGVPEAVVYKMGRLTYFLGSRFVKPRFFSLVNLILGREVVREILQTGVRQEITRELRRILEDDAYRAEMLDNFRELKVLLGESGAHLRLAERIYGLVGGKSKSISCQTSGTPSWS